MSASVAKMTSNLSFYFLSVKQKRSLTLKEKDSRGVEILLDFITHPYSISPFFHFYHHIHPTQIWYQQDNQQVFEAQKLKPISKLPFFLQQGSTQRHNSPCFFNALKFKKRLPRLIILNPSYTFCTSNRTLDIYLLCYKQINLQVGSPQKKRFNLFSWAWISGTGASLRIKV